MNLNDYRAEDLPPAVSPAPRRWTNERWIDWRHEPFVYGAIVVGIVLCVVSVCVAIAAPKVVCALQAVSSEYCLAEIGVRK